MANKKAIHKRIYQFTCHFIPDEEAGGFVVEVPALPGCVTQGRDLREAKKMVREAIELYCETLRDRGLPIPEDQDIEFFKSKVEVPLSLKTGHAQD